LEGIESTEKRRKKAEDKGVIEERDRDSLCEPVKSIGPVLSHDFCIVITTASLYNLLAIDKLKQIRGKEKEEESRKCTFG
jgi:hypothetical protein